MYEVKRVANIAPPKMLSKPPALFTIRDSLTDVDDIRLWCNGLYGVSVDGDRMTLKYWELHEVQPGEWSLEAVSGETQHFIVRENGDLVEM
jgi:hypothetical protein